MSLRPRMMRSSNCPPWWIRPDRITLAFIFPVLLAGFLVSDEVQSYFGRPQKNLTVMYFIIGMAGISCFWIGSFVGSKMKVPNQRSLSCIATDIRAFRAQIVLASRVILILTMIGYSLYMLPVAANPDLIINILTGDPGAVYISLEMRENIRIPGVTSITQFGIIYVVLFVLRFLYLPSPPAFERIAFAALMGLALIRSIAYSERLAIIELLIPVVVLLCRHPKLPRLLLAVFPVMAVGIIFVFFSGLEYFRSWQDHYQYIESDFVGFCVYRLFGYYINALDTGAGFLDYIGGGIGPITTFAWFWFFPVDFGQATILQGLGFNNAVFSDFLQNYANAEFNNSAGLFSPFVDYGVEGGAMCWLVLGLISGILFSKYLDGTLVGLILYPSWYTSIIEIPRTFNFGATRYFPALVISICIILWVFITKRSTITVARGRALGS